MKGISEVGIGDWRTECPILKNELKSETFARRFIVLGEIHRCNGAMEGAVGSCRGEREKKMPLNL